MKRNTICLPIMIQDTIDRDLLQSFVDARCEDIKPITQRGVDMLIRKLSRMEQQGHCPNLLLERSIINGWQDVYPDESTRKAQSFVASHTDRSWADNVRAIR